jgi:hypothetical protein
MSAERKTLKSRTPTFCGQSRRNARRQSIGNIISLPPNAWTSAGRFRVEIMEVLRTAGFKLSLCTVLLQFTIWTTTVGLPTTSTIPTNLTSSQTYSTNYPILYVNGGVLSCEVLTGVPFMTSTATLGPWYTILLLRLRQFPTIGQLRQLKGT